MVLLCVWTKLWTILIFQQCDTLHNLQGSVSHAQYQVIKLINNIQYQHGNQCSKRPQKLTCNLTENETCIARWRGEQANTFNTLHLVAAVNHIDCKQGSSKRKSNTCKPSQKSGVPCNSRSVWQGWVWKISTSSAGMLSLPLLILILNKGPACAETTCTVAQFALVIGTTAGGCWLTASTSAPEVQHP